MRVPRMPTGVRFKVSLAVLATLLALAAIASSAVRATRSATVGADRVKAEFAERVDNDKATLAATENRNLAEQQLGGARSGEDDLAARGGASDEQLAQAIDVMLAPGRVRPQERDAAGRIRAAYDAYRERRRELLDEAPVGDRRRAAAVAELRRSFAPLQAALTSYAGIHYAEANAALSELREAGRIRNIVLVLTLGFGVLSLLGIALVARGIVERVRGYGAFAREVAQGDLTARLRPRGRDELAGLGNSLNEMVEQLATAARDRDERQEAERSYRETQDAFSQAMQVAESESEAHGVLKRHLERCVPGSTVTVLVPGDEAGRPLALDGSREPPVTGSCLAARLGSTQVCGGDAQAILRCEFCGAAPRPCTCSPILVSRGAIGSVLVDHAQPLDAFQERHLHDSVAQAAPVLANLRNLALAEHQAATDALTGLPNHRSVHHELERMMAQSRRRGTPLAAIMLDLDHFKQINDTLGHEHGDRVLAAVGATLAATVRASDFVGRTGGEEFVVLLPDSSAGAAVAVAEKLRASVAALWVDGIERAVTASLGVAVHPDVADDAESLLRVADRALYGAKAAGRDRVQLAVRGAEPRDAGGRAHGTVPEGRLGESSRPPARQRFQHG